jgi:hypothetical protein
MYMLLKATTGVAPVSTATGYLIFAVSLIVLAGVLKYFTSTNEI